MSDYNQAFPSLHAVLFYEEAPSLESLDLFLKIRVPDIEPVDGKERHYRCGGEAIQSQLVFENRGMVPAGALRGSLAHTYNWPGVVNALERTRSTVIVRDFMAEHLAPAERCRRLLAAIAAAHETEQCEAIWVPSAELFVDPEVLLDHVPLAGEAHPLFGLVNVRVFSLDGAPEGEQLMDTAGLAALGLLDLQCHFTGFERVQVAEMLFHGAVSTVEGELDPSAPNGWPAPEWTTRIENAIAPPARRVLDVCPPKNQRGTRPTSSIVLCNE